MTTAK